MVLFAFQEVWDSIFRVQKVKFFPSIDFELGSFDPYIIQIPNLFFWILFQRVNLFASIQKPSYRCPSNGNLFPFEGRTSHYIKLTAP